MKNIFIDESGYTGEDLLNQDQPFFVLASHDIEEDECRKLKTTYFSEVNATELKYSFLKKSKNQQDMVLNFLTDFLFKKDNYKTCVAYKKYVLVQKIVDFLVEPYMFDLGEDLYKDGQNIAMSNMLYYCLPSLGSKSFFEKLLNKFQNFMRNKNRKNYDELFFHINLIYGNKDLDSLLGILRPCDEIIGSNLIDRIPPHALDLSFTFGMLMMSQWRDTTKDEIVLIHDKTSNMSKQILEWQAVMSCEIDEQTIGWYKRKLNLPINIKETKFVSSKDWIGLQIADILAGVTTHFANWMASDKKIKNEYSEKLANLIQNVKFTSSLLPSTKVTPQELGTVGPKIKDANEVIGEIVFKAKNKST
jgi:hypothetical protein